MRLATVQLSSCALVAFITLFLVLVQMDEKYPLLPAMPMGRWSYVEVGNWIRSLGPEFGRYASEFERIGIDGATLITGMTETDWNQMIPDPNHRQTIQTARDRELTRNSSADDDAAESELLNRIRSAAPAGSAITVNVGALGRGAQQNNFYALPRNPRFALYAMAVLGVGVLLSLLAAKDEPQWPATISELFHDPKTPHGTFFWAALVLGGTLLLASGRLEWIQAVVPFTQQTVPVGDISCLAMITIACIPIVPIDQVRTFGHVMQSRIHQTAAVMMFGVLPAAVCHTIFQRLPLVPGDDPNWIIHSRHAISAAAKQTRCFVPFFCAGGALLSFLSWQMSGPRFLGVPASDHSPSLLVPGQLIALGALVIYKCVWSFTLQLSRVTVLWSVIAGAADVLALRSPTYIAAGILGVIYFLLQLCSSESRDNTLRMIALFFPYLLGFSLETCKTAFGLGDAVSFGCELVCAVLVLAMICSLPDRPPLSAPSDYR